jgi:predicted SprT family Zn-dependent metalloprotease
MEIATAYALGRTLLKEHGLEEWTLKFTASRRRFGCCWHGKSLITMSKEMTKLNSEFAVKNVLLHEIAHALVGFGEGHGPVWKEKAISIGCDGIRCYDRSEHVVIEAPKRWIGKCPNCGHEIHRNARPRKRACACSACCKKFAGGVFDARFTLGFRRAA